MNNKTLKKCSTFLLIFSVVISSFGVSISDYKSALAHPIGELQDQYDGVEEAQKLIESKIVKSEEEKQLELKKQQDINFQISRIQSEIVRLEKEIDRIEYNIKKLEQEILVLEDEIESKYELYKLRLKAHHMSGDSGFLDILFNSTGLGDLFRRVESIVKIKDYDKRLIKDLMETKEKIELSKSKIEDEKKSIERNRIEVEKNKRSLEEALKHSQENVSNISRIQAEHRFSVEQLEAQKAQIENEIYEALKEADQNMDFIGGDWIWPVPGYNYISSHYGWRDGYLHKGTDIAGSGIHGKPIVAINSGKVIKVEKNHRPGYSYGMYVMVDHGGGYVSLYGHMSGIDVNVGDWVKRGQPIGKVGNTGWSTGPHLHLEIRVNGTAQNPMNYIKRP